MLAGLSSAFLLPAPATAERIDSEKPVANQSETDRLFDAYIDQLYSRKYAEALATTSKFDLDESNEEGRAIIKAMRAAALVGLKRDKEAAKLFAEADSAAPSTVLVSTLQLDAGLFADNFPVAAEALDRMIARMPDAVRELSLDAVSYFLRNEPKGQERRNEDRRILLAQLGFGGAAGDYFTSDAVAALTKRGEPAKAAELIPYIDDPVVLENLLIQKRYAALWPKIETSAGPNLHKARTASVQAARKEYDDDPDSTLKRQLLINALRHAGQLDAAIAFRLELPDSVGALTSADEDTGWAFNEVALALHEAGRNDEADQLFALLNSAPMEKAGWRVSMFINRLELLVLDGRFDRALPLIKPTEELAATDGNTYARQLVRRLKYCTLAGLGRKEEAAALQPELLKYASDAPGSTIEGLLCAGQVDEAEKLALATLKKDGFEADFVRRLQAKPLTSNDPSKWEGAWQALRKRPAIAAEFDRLGRDLPAEFLPPSPELTGRPNSPPGANVSTDAG